MRGAAAIDLTEREFPLSDGEFRFLAKLVYDHAGIVLGDNKRNMVYSRLGRRLRELRLENFADYCKLLQGPAGSGEFGNFINAVTTNLTKFFREPHHFDHLRSVVLPEIIARRTGRLRIWSAGCSSGEEPYTIAMTLRESIPSLDNMDARILATDLDTNMVETGRNGFYTRSSLGDVAPERVRRFFAAEDDTRARVDASLRKLITFKQLNLLADWPMQGQFDAIFCRNVMIYFDNQTKQALIDRFATKLRPGGWLYIGHSETLLDQRSAFELKGRTIYRKVA